jgi:hypothetical protein
MFYTYIITMDRFSSGKPTRTAAVLAGIVFSVVAVSFVGPPVPKPPVIPTRTPLPEPLARLEGFPAEPSDGAAYIVPAGPVSPAPYAFSAIPVEHTGVTNDVSGARPAVPEQAASSDSAAAKLAMHAFLDAYPDKVTEIRQRDGDWEVLIGSEWFSWANGRLLPHAIREDWERYDPVPFYSYTRELPPIPTLSEEEKRQLLRRVEEQEKNPPRRHPGFFNALWRVHDEASSYRMVKTTYFLGLKTEIHRDLLEDLASIEEEVWNTMERDRELRAYVNSLVQLEGYSWRPIAGTSSLSFHSYGTAIDILPKYYERKEVYWRWSMEYLPEWFSVPYERRYMPPESFVRIFENHGFVWGGKWVFYDTIHFEYRPEILLLNNVFTE